MSNYLQAKVIIDFDIAHKLDGPLYAYTQKFNATPDVPYNNPTAAYL
jgi:hypothetical protein